jgi:hypothetical protein
VHTRPYTLGTLTTRAHMHAHSTHATPPFSHQCAQRAQRAMLAARTHFARTERQALERGKQRRLCVGAGGGFHAWSQRRA